MRDAIVILLMAGAGTVLGASWAVGQDVAGKPDAAGKTVFEANCMTCHGPGGKGDGPIAAGLQPQPANFTDQEWKYGGDLASVKKTISTGVAETAMPPWGSFLKPEEIDAVAHYVLTFSQGGSTPAAGPQPSSEAAGSPAETR
jgi:cbb3-type cytochrome c oxidase subunit III